MKFFIALFALAAVAFAEPEADADPAVFYGRHFGYHASPLAYNSYAHAGAYSPYAHNFYGYAGLGYNNFYGRNFYGYNRLFKRDAEADPAVFYSNAYHYGHAHAATPLAYAGHHAYSPYAHNYLGYAGLGYTGLGYSGLGYAGLGYAHHAIAPAATHVTQASAGGVASTAAIHSGNRVFGGYANAGNYVANSAGVVHVAKREAEADPAVFYSSAYNYSPFASTYATHAYAPTAYAHHAYAPYSLGYRSFSPYYNHLGYRNFGAYHF